MSVKEFWTKLDNYFDNNKEKAIKDYQPIFGATFALSPLNKSQDVLFFKPWKNQDFLTKFIRGSSIVLAPIAFGILSYNLLLSCMIHLLKIALKLITLQFTSAKLEAIDTAREAFIHLPTSLILGAISPITNAIDVIGGLMKDTAPGTQEQKYQTEALQNLSAKINT